MFFDEGGRTYLLRDEEILLKKDVPCPWSVQYSEGWGARSMISLGSAQIVVLLFNWFSMLDQNA